MPQRWTWVAALSVAVALAGCGSSPAPTDEPSPSPAAPTTTSPADPTPTPTPTPTPAPLTEAAAAEALAKVAVPTGFRVDVQCPPRTAADQKICGTPNDKSVAWAVSRTYLGPRLPRANGLTSTVTLNLTAATSAQAAERFYRAQATPLRSRDGRFDVPVAQQGGGYTPGRRGRGTLTTTGSRGWRGTDLQERYVLVFDAAPSGALTSGTRVLRRGGYVANVSWTAGDRRSRAELADLADRVLAALDRSG